MVAVWMRIHQQVDAPYAGALEVGQHDALADELGRRFAAVAAAAFEPASAVDKDGVAARRADHDAVALADVEHGDR